MSEDIPFSPERPAGPSHYYGDVVRVLFVIASALLIIAQFIGTPFMTSTAAVVAAAILVIAAGMTNPVQIWIQWVNVIISTACLILFGAMALDRYQKTSDIFGQNFMLLILVGIFIVALYTAVRTLRGQLMRNAPVIT